MSENGSALEKGLFRRIFLLYGGVLLLALLALELTVTGAVRANRIASLTGSLSAQAELIADSIPVRPSLPIDDLCRRLKEKTGARVTVIAPDGRVLGDSDHPSSTMDNHHDRIEVRQADMRGIGMAVRRSDTLDTDLLYVARKIVLQGADRGFIRLSVPLGEVDASVHALRVKIGLTVAGILFATAIFPLRQIDRVRRLTIQIRDFAAALSRGELGKRLFLDRAGEFEEIARSLNAMTLELQHNIAAGEEERNRLSVILSSIPDALLISDAQGVVRLTSAASRAFFGDQDLEGRQFIEIVRDRKFLALLEDVRKRLLPGTADVTLEHPQERHCIVRVSPLFYRMNEPSGIVVIFHDVTQLKKLEQVRKDFVANISHEIRTPITAIQGFSETLLDGALEDRENSRRFIETIRENSKRINSLVDDLMTISKIELGVITVEKSDVVFQDAAEAAFAVLGKKAAEKGLSLAMEVPPDMGVVRADRDRLVQILTNLIDNAIKFTDKGGVTVGLRESGGRPVIFVSDTGIGIAEKHLPRLGERFYRVDAARSRNMGGTGLGLAIVKHLVKAHGWELRVESAPGKGTTLTILPEPEPATPEETGADCAAG